MRFTWGLGTRLIEELLNLSMLLSLWACPSTCVQLVCMCECGGGILGQRLFVGVRGCHLTGGGRVTDNV